MSYHIVSKHTTIIPFCTMMLHGAYRIISLLFCVYSPSMANSVDGWIIRLTTSHHITSHHAISYRIISYHITLFHVISCRVLSVCSYHNTMLQDGVVCRVTMCCIRISIIDTGWHTMSLFVLRFDSLRAYR
jgi:hypothetical protein